MYVNRSKLVVIIISIFGLNASMEVARAEFPCEVAQLSPSDADQGFGDEFGRYVAISGDYIAIGASRDSEIGSLAGAVYVFERDGANWIEQTKLTASDGGFQEKFGRSVAIDGDRIVVGAPHINIDGSSNGSAYVFRLVGNNWVEDTKLIPSLSATTDRYGRSVSISGDVIVVGAQNSVDGRGRAHVFRWNGNNWIEEEVLIGDDTVEDDSFGISVAIDNNLIVVGSSADDDAGAGSGSVYVFGYNGTSWIQDAKLTSSDAGAGDNFGFTVSVSGDYVVVGAPLHDDQVSDTGSSYVYWLNGGVWIEQFIFSVSNSSNLGFDVSMHDDRLMVSAPGTSGAPVYILQRRGSDWIQTDTLITGGLVVDFVGDYAVVGPHGLGVAVYGIGPVPPCIPTTSQWGMIVMSSILLIAGVIILRKHSFRASACVVSLSPYVLFIA